ncbi:DNA polymerase I [Candidatus Dojkabacteria bacterium]|nr:DNA polymerase I [Candidatus Dojkabacteria bacterium]
MNLVKTSKDRFLAIDANAIVHRAFHAYPSSLQTEKGTQVNAAYGFTVMLLEALDLFDPKYVLCSFDTAKPTFRHVEFQEYKGTRKPTDQSLIDQFPIVEEILTAFNIPILKKEGFEADDVLGTISKYVREGKWSNEDIELYILSGDKDLLQLVSDNVKVCLPQGNFRNLIAYDRIETKRKFKMYPEQIVDYKAMAGDASDNIPGVKGVGSKTAIELLNRYGSLNEIYKNLSDVKSRYALLLREGVEQAEMSRRLATIEQDVDIQIKLENCLMRDFNKSDVLEVFHKYSFRSLIPKIDKLKKDEQKQITTQLDIFSSNQSEVEWTNEEKAMNICKNADKIVLAYIDEKESSLGKGFFFLRKYVNPSAFEDYLLEKIEPIIISNCEKVIYNLEGILSDVGEPKGSLFDLGFFAHLINSERRGYLLKDLAFDYSSYMFGDKIHPSEIKKVLDAIDEIQQTQIKKAKSIELYEYTRKSMRNILGIDKDYFLGSMEKIEVPISKVLSKMEKRGIMVDVPWLESLNVELSESLEMVKKEIYDSVGHEFNINSPKQLSDVLFNELKLPDRKKGSTRETVLDLLSGTHPVVENILEYRELSKIHTTYVLPLLELGRNSEDSTIHTDFKQTGTSSGRLSSVNPNMQNIPVQGRWAEKIRKSFVAKKGFKLLGMDYSQIELRVLADMSEDKLLIEDFQNNVDIHKATASRILKKEIEDITKKERSLGKTVNFGILFGQTAFGLANMLKIDNDVASGYIQSYFQHYTGVEEYMRSLEKEAYKRGYVQTMFGTTRWIKGIKSRNIRLMRAAQREAINMPIQGGEADIMKYAMIQLDGMIEKEFKNEAFILLQIHDELIFEVKEERVKEFEKKAREIMKSAVTLNVHLDVSSAIGDNMSELKG